jgi:phosphate transport system ATP-binding protein
MTATLPLAAPPRPERQPRPATGDVAFRLERLSAWYGEKQALRDITMEIPKNRVTAIIGPSGCGKSTLLRCLDRMNDLIPGFRLEGRVAYEGEDIYAPQTDAALVRRRIGMVFQKPNPFPKSIFDNVAYGARINGFGGDLRGLVQHALERAALWDEVRDRLEKPALTLSGGQQQRLCIARALAVEPEVLLMDEPASALDPIATYRIEELISDLVRDYTIVIVTHNMQQASRVSDLTAFMLAGEERIGELIEFDATDTIFTTPRDQRTEAYITGRFG